MKTLIVSTEYQRGSRAQVTEGRNFLSALRGHGVPQSGEALLNVIASLALKRIVMGALVHMTAWPTASMNAMSNALTITSTTSLGMPCQYCNVFPHRYSNLSWNLYLCGLLHSSICPKYVLYFTNSWISKSVTCVIFTRPEARSHSTGQLHHRTHDDDLMIWRDWLTHFSSPSSSPESMSTSLSSSDMFCLDADTERVWDSALTKGNLRNWEDFLGDNNGGAADENNVMLENCGGHIWG